MIFNCFQVVGGHPFLLETNEKVIVCGNFLLNLVNPWDQLSHLEDVINEPGEDREEVVEDRLVQTWTEDYVRLQQLHFGKKERLGRLLLFCLRKKQE